MWIIRGEYWEPILLFPGRDIAGSIEVGRTEGWKKKGKYWLFFTRVGAERGVK